MDDGALWCVIISFALTLLSAVFIGFLTAVTQTVAEEPEEPPEREDKGLDAFNAHIRDRFRLTGIYFASLCLTIVACGFGLSCSAYYLSGVIPGHDLWPVRVVFLILFAILVCAFGVLIPMRIAMKASEAWVEKTRHIVVAIGMLFVPFAWVARMLARGVVRIFRVNYDDAEDSVTEQGIITMVNEGAEQGVLEDDEAEMITNIFEYGDKEAADVMTHRGSIKFLSRDCTLAEALHELATAKNTRYPVCGADIDEIIGILHMREALEAMENKENLQKKLCEIDGLLQTPVYVPETKNIDDLLREMQKNKNHMVIVLDEYGQTSGLITMEDILEEIVGNIMDEYDEDEETITKKEDGSFDIPGLTPFDEAAQLLAIDRDEEAEEVETLNGYILNRLDHIPTDQEHPTLEADGWRFEAFEIHKGVIGRVHVTKLPEPEEINEN
ncbi:MAG: HlyC/CorC family transporter [Lachnospiraceae bacterium]|nr:HlyC/CorC family transporter [Lachnospiraceae bacterium]